MVIGYTVLLMALILFLETIPIRYLLALSAITTVSGDYFGKLWSINHQTMTFVIAFILYATGGLFFIPTLAKESLVVSTIVWVLLAEVGNLAIGLLAFHEKIDVLQSFGLAFGFVAICIFAIRH